MDKLTRVSKMISDKSEHVRINESGIERFCKAFEPKKMQHWLAQAPFDIRTLKTEDRLAYLAVSDLISFSYWGDPKWTIQHNGVSYDGAWAMLACLGRAVQEKTNFLDPDYLAQLPIGEFREILRGNKEIPLLNERLSHLHEIGRVVTSKYAGRFRHIIEEANFDADNLLRIIIRDFPSFKDVSKYDSERVEFYKRARLLVSDIGHACKGKDGIEMIGLENMTACADYKLPQVMRRYGILEYSTELLTILQSKTEIPKGDKKEVEIRANTIHAVELIKKRMCRFLSGINSMDINDYLWLEGQVKLPTDEPYHRTRTTAY
ncbi:MAG: queuosine salvage family protein [archaeon]